MICANGSFLLWWELLTASRSKPELPYSHRKGLLDFVSLKVFVFNSRKWKPSNTSPFFCQPWKNEDTMDSFLRSHVPKSCLSRRKSMWMAVQYSSKLKSKGQKQLFENTLNVAWFRSESFPLLGCMVTKVLRYKTKYSLQRMILPSLLLLYLWHNPSVPFSLRWKISLQKQGAAGEPVWVKT